MAWSPWLNEDWRAQMQRAEKESLEEVFYALEGVDLEQGIDPRESTLSDVPDPFSFRDMRKAVDFSKKIIAAQGSILIYGDYDADGLTSTAILARFFRQLGVDYRIIIPDRLDDGYGLSMETIEKIIADPPELVVTVDCGISALAEISLLKEHGIPCIITDHHQCPEQLPPAVAIINPQCPDETYPFPDLAGVAVAFNYVWALATDLALEEFEGQTYLTLVALGTVADAMPLHGVNRILVREGLKDFLELAPIGLSVLAKDLSTGAVPDSRFLGFSLAPRLNAAGRLSRIEPALSLLLSDDIAEATEAANELNNLNLERRRIEAEILAEAEEILAADSELATDNIVVLSAADWHPGVIGIVATRLMEKLQKPVVMLAPGSNGVYRASARAPEGVDLVKILAKQSQYLDAFGGHCSAAGFTTTEEQIAKLRLALAEAEIDLLNSTQKEFLCALEHTEVSANTVEFIESFGPYGQEHEEPVFELDDVEILSPNRIGDGRHFACNIRLKDSSILRGIAFVRSEALKLIRHGERVNIYGNLRFNYFRGRRSLQFQIVDIVPANDAQLYAAYLVQEGAYLEGLNCQEIASKLSLKASDLSLTAQAIKDFYHFLTAEFSIAKLVDLDRLTRAFNHYSHSAISIFTVRRMLELFLTQGFISLQELSKRRIILGLAPSPEERVKLAETKTWKRLSEQGFAPTV
ncbi:MAG: single-stranded-DNA-specific exonuclease RecJ [Eubacteriales bacterium]|nr:single-stranded-DNA-specific exonuclease RecJ [Eubacteriales bacterium]